MRKGRPQGRPFCLARGVRRVFPGGMAKAVFIASSHSSYDDRPGEVYHFPRQYLSRVAQTVGDWVLL